MSRLVGRGLGENRGWQTGLQLATESMSIRLVTESLVPLFAANACAPPAKAGSLGISSIYGRAGRPGSCAKGRTITNFFGRT